MARPITDSNPFLNPFIVLGMLHAEGRLPSFVGAELVKNETNYIWFYSLK